MNKKKRAVFFNLNGELAYFSYVQSILPPNSKIQIDDELINLLIEAHKISSILDDIAKKYS